MQHHTGKKFHAVLGILGHPIQPNLRSGSEAKPAKKPKELVFPKFHECYHAQQVAHERSWLLGAILCRPASACLSLSQPAHTSAVQNVIIQADWKVSLSIKYSVWLQGVQRRDYTETIHNGKFYKLKTGKYTTVLWINKYFSSKQFC